ncbi:hypothetical protein ISX56_31720, partial [Serratia ureilytica]|nr:hypothetical protein [Serratia ureilytica]
MSSKATATFYIHDYETFGKSPSLDRFGALDLGHDLGVAACVARQAASIVQIF